MNAIPCSICQQDGHRANRCPELSAPLRPGFFAPSGGGGGHSHDDDERARAPQPGLTIRAKRSKQIRP